MAKQLLFQEEAQRKILKGIEKLAKTVKITLGPGGRNVILKKSFGSPVITRSAPAKVLYCSPSARIT